MAAQFAQACISRYEQSLQLILAPCREALELLLPYDTHWDKRSWWYSQYCVIMLCAAFLNQHRLQINASCPPFCFGRRLKCLHLRPPVMQPPS